MFKEAEADLCLCFFMEEDHMQRARRKRYASVTVLTEKGTVLKETPFDIIIAQDKQLIHGDRLTE